MARKKPPLTREEQQRRGLIESKLRRYAAELDKLDGGYLKLHASIGDIYARLGNVEPTVLTMAEAITALTERLVALEPPEEPPADEKEEGKEQQEDQ